MLERIVIRASGNALEISPDGKSELPAAVLDVLTPELRYYYLRMPRGNERYGRAGKRGGAIPELRLMYVLDEYGRLVCGAGFLSRVVKLLKDAGYSPDVIDMSRTHPRRPDRYELDWVNVAANFSFRARQDEAIVKLSAVTHGICDAPTGFGKTFLYKAMALLYPHAKIVITTRRKDLVEGIRSNLARDLPNIGQIGGGLFQPSRVTVVTADSLHKVETDEVDILIGEEAHELAADTYARELARFSNCRMYGFTATPTGRMDNADKRLESLFGPVVFRMTYPEAVDLGLVVPIRVRWLDVYGEDVARGYADVQRKRWGLWRHDNRNEIIAAEARKFRPDEQVLIMVTTFEHAVYLRQHLPDFTLCYAERGEDEQFNRYVKNGLLPADEPVITPQRRQDLRKAFEAGTLKKVIATDVWSTGVSFNSLAVLIRADARGSEIMDTQIPGRVCRLDDKTVKPEGLVIDCLDQFNAGFKTSANKRKRNYESKGWIQDMPRKGRQDLM